MLISKAAYLVFVIEVVRRIESGAGFKSCPTLGEASQGTHPRIGMEWLAEGVERTFG